MKLEMNEDDQALIQDLYDLSDAEVREAVRLYNRSHLSICAAGRTIKERRNASANAAQAD